MRILIAARALDTIGDELLDAAGMSKLRAIKSDPANPRDIDEQIAVGAELSPAYCYVCVERWQDVSGGKATRGK